MSSESAREVKRIALVTGAAARIGAAVAGQLHGRGCDVIVHCNANQEGAEAMVARLEALRPGSASVACADLSDPDGVEALAAEVRERHGRLDILVNNASRFYPTPIGETHAWQWDDLLNSNLRGPYFLVQALLDELRTAGGCIVNILDVHAERPMPDHPVYCITKAGMAMLTRSLAADLGPSIRVNGVAPGAILWPEREPGAAEKQAILDRTALRRLGDPADIASAVTYLALDAPYVTGQVLAVDGGRSLNI